MRSVHLLLLFFVMALAVVSAATPKDETYLGEIMDNRCAMMGGSHDAMMSGNPK
jgi:hypothetical protein